MVNSSIIDLLLNLMFDSVLNSLLISYLIGRKD